MRTERPNVREVLDCGGRAQRRHRFRTGESLSDNRPCRGARKRWGALLPAAVQDVGAFASLLFLAIALFISGCATAPRPQIQRPPDSFPTDALITQRGVLTVLGRQFTLNGYLASSSTNGQRLIITENFGGVLADLLVKPDGSAHVMRSSRAFKPKWITRYIAADVRCLFGTAPEKDCPGQMLGPKHFLIERRWYKLDLQIVEIKPGPQPAEMFDATKAEKP